MERSSVLKNIQATVLFSLWSGISAVERVALFWNTLTILSTVFRKSSSGKLGFVMKHPIYAVNCIQGFQLWKVWLCSETPELCCQLCSGISALESVAVFWNTLTILSTVFRDFSSGKGGCVLKHNNYPVNCVQEFQLWKVWLYSETP